MEKEKLLSEKLRNSYEATQHIELRTKATSFRNLSRISKSKNPENELLKKISDYVKKQPQIKEESKKEDSEITIVENPDDIQFVFPNLSDIAPDVVMPFFKSVSYKLTKIYG